MSKILWTTPDVMTFERFAKNLRDNSIKYQLCQKLGRYIVEFEFPDNITELELTANGIRIVSDYLAELNTKRKEILDAGLDTADETSIPDADEILDDIMWTGIDEQGEYYNGWGVTDNYDADSPILLKIGRDFLIA